MKKCNNKEIYLFFRLFFLLSLLLAFSGCKESDSQIPSHLDFTIESVKALSADIATVRVEGIDQKNSAYRIAIDINKDPVTGGAQDWNSVAIMILKLSKVLLLKPKVHELNFTFWMTDSSATDWASVSVKQDKLPSNWQHLTYQEFFALSDTKPGSVHSGHWLCDFYQQYKLAKPKEGLPDFCIVTE